jgi:ribosome-binding factor A
MAREFGRNSRVSSQIQKELAQILQRSIKDPRLGFVTVNEVVVSKDLAIAKVYVTVLNADKATIRENIDILNDAAPYLRSELDKHMKMRMIPELRFYYDDSMDRGLRVSELLNEVDDNPVVNKSEE